MGGLQVRCRARFLGLKLSLALVAGMFLAAAPAMSQTITNNVSLLSDSLPSPIQSSVDVQLIVSTNSTITFMQRNSGGTLVPTSLFHAGQDIYVQVEDGDQNLNPAVAETIVATLVNAITGDNELVTLTETGPDTGIFTGSMSSTTGATAANDGSISVASGSQLTATYADIFNGADISTAVALVDPFGLIFNSATGAPVDGLSITIIDNATNLPATVYGDDGVSAFPSTITTGGTATDSSGTVYNFAPGSYRFPFVSPGSYRFDIAPAASYAFPSTQPDASLQALPGAPFALTIGSRGEVFIVNPGPALHIDLPVDPVAMGLFVQKQASRPSAGIGDAVAYRISIDNPATVADTTGVIVQDILPPGLRYLPGSARRDGAVISDPVISGNGRKLDFALGLIPAGGQRQLSYVATLGANTPLGEAVNIALANGMQLGLPTGSNTAKASIRVVDDLFAGTSFVIGRVFIDDNDNGLDEGEDGVAGVRVYIEDGRFATTDRDGHYHFEGIMPGTHIVQLDVDSLPPGTEALALDNNRFAGQDFSQFADLAPSALWRANFRLKRLPPPVMPVTIEHRLEASDNPAEAWVNILIVHAGEVPLLELHADYLLPAGWRPMTDSASVNGTEQEPTASDAGLSWLLDPDQSEHVIRFAMARGGQPGRKQASAIARFVSQGSGEAHSDAAVIDIDDMSEEQRAAMESELRLNFHVLADDLPMEELARLDELVEKLRALEINRLEIDGHSDSTPIAARSRHLFADNTSLSLARARFVANYLGSSLNIPESRVRAVGKGESEPVADNATREGRRLNRRVVVRAYADRVWTEQSTTMVQLQAEAQATAVGSWERPESRVEAAADEVPADGILSPADGAGLAHASNPVRVQLDSRLKPRLLLDGMEVDAGRIGLTAVDAESGKTTYSYIGVDFGGRGSHSLQLQGIGPFGNTRFDQTINVTRTGEIAAIRLLEAGSNTADGATPVRLRLQLIDSNGEIIQAPAELELRGGDLLPSQDREISHIDRNDMNRLTDTAVQSLVTVDAEGWLELAPTTVSGMHQIILGYNDVQRTIRTFVRPAYRDWIMVGLGEGSIGHNTLKGAMQPIASQDEEDGFYQDGRLAFYAKGRVRGDFLLTLAYDTAKTEAQTGNSLHQVIDPDTYYTVYGDASEQQYDAASQSKLYLKLERDAFYALFGDYQTGLTVTELSRYSRNLNGLKSEYAGERFGYNAFAASTSQTLVKDELRGDGTSGLYQLSRRNLVLNSETVFVETRDRFKSELVLESRQLARHLDYDIDYATGTLFFRQPVPSKDASLNPIYIRVEYESNDSTDDFTTFGGRASARVGTNMEVGASYIQQGQLGEDDKLGGVDAAWALNAQTEIRAEIARSDKPVTGTADAYKAEIAHVGQGLRGRAYVRQLDDGFGLGQTLGSENGTRKFGLEGDLLLMEHYRALFESYRQQMLATGAKRDLAHAQLNYTREGTILRAGLRTARDVDGAGVKHTSNQLTLGATSIISDRLSLRIDREQNIGSHENSVDFPTWTIIGADYRLTANTILSTTHEWTQGDLQNAQMTHFGVRTRPWSGAQLASSYGQQLGEAGSRSFANIGLQQTWQLSDALNVDASVDHSSTIRHTGAVPLNINAPLASGGGENFAAASFGFTYRPEDWIWNNRFEYRVATSSQKWNGFSAIEGEPRPGLATAASLRWLHTATNAGDTATQAGGSIAAAWRPAYDGWAALDKFELRYDNMQGATNQTTWRYINNLHANWQADARWQTSMHYGAKWVRDSIDGASYAGFADLIGVQSTFDVTPEWDVSAHASLLHTWRDGGMKPGIGLGVGYNVVDNAWLGVGYNFTGFYDGDFAAAEFTRQGVFATFRFKFDQHNLAGMLKNLR